jgi:outer membrane protein OmpA-like peptidoglycan-associated protein
LRITARIPFPGGSAVLSPMVRAQLDDAAREIAATGARRVWVRGHALDAPPGAVRASVAGERASVVRAWLVAHGAAEEVLVQQSSASPADDDVGSDRAMVDFVVLDPSQVGCCFEACI